MACRGHVLAVAEDDTQRRARAPERALPARPLEPHPFPSPGAVAGKPVPMSDSDAVGDRNAGGRDQPPRGSSIGERDPASFTHAGTPAGLFTQTPGLHQLLVESVRDYAIFALDPNGAHPELERRRGAHQGLRGGARSSAGTSRSSTRRGPRGRQAGARARERGARRASRGRGVARPEGRHAVLGERRHHRAARRGGTLVGFAKVTRDLTERRRAEERAARERGALPAPHRERAGLRHLHARPRRARRELERGRASASRATRPTRSSAGTSRRSIPRRDARPGLPRLRARGRAREGRFEDEGWRVRKDGTRFWANVVITALRDDDGDAHRLREGHARPHRAPRRAGARDRRRAPARRGRGRRTARRASSSRRCRTSCARRSTRSPATRSSCRMGSAARSASSSRTTWSASARSQQHLLGDHQRPAELQPHRGGPGRRTSCAPISLHDGRGRACSR